MNAKTILKLIATQDYDELKRLALAEVCEKDAKTVSERTVAKAIIKLSLQTAKNKIRPTLAGAYYDNDFMCITDGHIGFVTSRKVSGCFFAKSDGFNVFDLKYTIRKNCPGPETFKKMDSATVSKIKVFFDMAKASGDKRTPLVKIGDAFFNFKLFTSVFECFIDPVYSVSENSIQALILKDESSEGIVLPTRIFDVRENNEYFLIAKWGE